MRQLLWEAAFVVHMKRPRFKRVVPNKHALNLDRIVGDTIAH